MIAPSAWPIAAVTGRTDGRGATMQHSNRAGLLYTLAGFATLSIGDAIIKGMAEMWPPTAMAATR